MNTHLGKARVNGVSGRTIRGMKRNPLFATIVGSLALMAASNTFAQEAAQPAPAEPAAAESANDPATLDTVIVTANKRSQNIRDVASGISVIGGDRLENFGFSQLTDFASYMPGLQVQNNGSPGRTTVSMRGIAPLSSGATVGTYIDETPVGSSGLYQAATVLALDLLPYDIDRIEVLRGPQGTLYGAGSMGGLLKYVTRAPDLEETEFRAGGGVSDVSGGGELGNNLRAAVNLPIEPGRLGLRMSFSQNNLPGYIDNVLGENDFNEGTQRSARAALLWRGDAASFQLTALQQSISTDNNALMALDPDTLEPIHGDLTTQQVLDEPFDKDIAYFSATLQWDLGWADFTSATGYSDTDTMIRSDATVPYGELAIFYLGQPEIGSSYFDNTFQLEKFTQEFRLASKGDGPVQWLVGAFYSDEEGFNSQDAKLHALDGSLLPTPPPPFDFFVDTLAYLEIPSDYREIAVFGNVDWKISERFTLGAGVRYAENDQFFSQNVSDGFLLPIGEAPNESEEDVFTWSLTPQFRLGEDSLLYAKIATGYQPGGPNVLLPGIPPQVDSSMLTSYELGWKTAFVDGTLLLDVAAFRIDWEDIQVLTSFAGVTGLANGGEATSEGVEFSTQFRATESLTLGFTGTWTDASIAKDYPTVYIPSGPYIVELNTGLAGDQLPYVPEWQWSATADYYFPVGSWEGHVGGGFRWLDERVNGTTERQVITDGATGTPLVTSISAPLELDSYYALDLFASVSNDTWSIRGYVKNATDERGYSSMSTLSTAATGVDVQVNAVPIQPRTVGLELDFRF